MNITLKKIQDGDSDVWQVRCWQNGRYVRKQFKLRDDAIAHRELLEKEAEAADGVTIPEADRHSVWMAYQRARAGGYSLVQACDLFEKSLLMKVNRIALGEAVNQFMAVKRAKRLRERSLGNLQCRLDCMKLKIGETTSVHDITLPKLQECISGSWSDRSVINFRLVARNFFGWCASKRYCLSNIADELEKPLTEDRPPVILTPDEVEEMLVKARSVAPHLVPYIAISVFAGVRNKEMSRLTWEDVDLKQMVIRIDSHKSKTRARRLVTIQPNLAKWLALKGDLPSGTSQKHWMKVRPSRYEADAMRRTFCSYHLAQFQSAAQTAIQAGHRESVLFSHYRGLVTQEDAKRFWVIEPK